MVNVLKLAALAAIAALLGGCMVSSNAPGGTMPTSVSCSGANCRVQVGYECFIACKVLVAQEIVVNDPARRWNQPIVWELPADSDLKFAADGIHFDDPSFHCAATEVRDGNRRWQCTNNGREGRFKYTVALDWRGVPVRLDPWVINR